MWQDRPVVSVLFDGVTSLPDDAFVLQAVRAAAARDPLYGAAALIGICNLEGDIYRMVQCQGMSQTRRVTTCLRALRFGERPATGSGYHYVFGR